jgi:hypothetical protein
VEAQLQGRAQALHPVSGHDAASGQVVGGVSAPCVATVVELLPAISQSRRRRAGEDPPRAPAFVLHHRSRRQPRFGTRVDTEGESFQRVLDALELTPINGEVEVGMRSGLLAYQRINAPTAVQPDSDAFLFERVHDLEHAVGFHASL